MKHQAIRYDFTIRELCYFLFGRKKCPKCGGELEKEKSYETRKGSDFNSKRGSILARNARVKHYVYTYNCQKCNSQFSLQELAE